jgi:hypothetical protein
MHWLSIPEPHKNTPLAFTDLRSAENWVVAEAQAQALPMLVALSEQTNAIDAATMPPAQTMALLNLIRSAAVPAVEKIEARYTRKRLPMQPEDQRHAEAVQQLWTRLGIAYLRLAIKLPPSEKGPPLHRAACTLRMAEYSHIQAASECPMLLDQLLFAVLAEGDKSGLLLEPLADSDFPHFGDANITGHLVWAFLLRLIDAYQLTGNQLAVANRAISRWRELCSFQFELDANPKSQAIDLTRIFGPTLPADIPRWLNIRSLVRKSRQRIEALQTGQTPESLKLGRELSGAACIRLLNGIIASFRPPIRSASNESGPITLSFGSEHAYAVIRGELLNPTTSLGAKSANLAHQRMEIFGFDRLSQMPNAVKTLNIPGEVWLQADGRATRPAQQVGARLLSPCLIANMQHGKPRLGVMQALQTTSTGDLAARLDWYQAGTEAGLLKQSSQKTPIFLLHAEGIVDLIVPANVSVRLDTGQALTGTSIPYLVPTEVLERGIDFVRYACRLS